MSDRQLLSQGSVRSRRTSTRLLSRRAAIRSRRGISLLSLLLTILGIGLTVAVVVPRFFTKTNVTLDNAAVVFAKDLRAAQQRSSFVHQPSRFEVRSDGYRVVDATGELVLRYGSQEKFERSFGPLSVHAGVEIVAMDLGADSAIDIDAVGLATESGSLTLRFQGRERRITFRPGRGLIDIEGLDRDWRAEMD